MSVDLDRSARDIERAFTSLRTALAAADLYDEITATNDLEDDVVAALDALRQTQGRTP